METEELKRLLQEHQEDLKKTVDERFQEVKVQIHAQQTSSLEAHEATRKQVTILSKHVTALWRKVNGSDPPPPANGSSLPPGETATTIGSTEITELPVPLDEKISQHDLAMAGLEAQMIGVKGEMQAMKSTVNDAKEVAIDVKTVALQIQRTADSLSTEAKAQSKDMGIGTKGQAFIRTRSGQRFVLGFVAAIAAVIAATGTLYSAIRTSPSPVSPAEAAQHHP